MHKRIVLTGGHAATTALAVIEEIHKEHKNWDIYWIGPKRAMEGKEIETSAARVLPNMGVHYYPIVAGRLQMKWTLYTIPSLVRVPIGFLQSLHLLIKIKPNVIISFGGYAAFPVVFIGWVLRIPVIIHAQTVVVGLSNRLSFPFAKKIAIARKESLSFIPSPKVIVTGNPVMSSVKSVGIKKEKGNPPTLYITGGSTGSQVINSTVDKILEKLLVDFYIIHQTGELDFDSFVKRKETLPQNLSMRYEVVDFIEPNDIWKIYKKADILISRAGANTISEILITGRPSILIPHPKVTFDEQNKNANLAQKSGLVVVLKQDNLTKGALLEAIYYVSKNWNRMVADYDKTYSKLDAAASMKLVSLIDNEIS